MKALIPVIFFLVVPLSLFSQPFKSSGIVTDNVKKPIVAATISVPAKNIFYPTDENGKFSIQSLEIAPSDTIYFSCIGFTTIKLLAGKLNGSGLLIPLEPKTNQLTEVTITASKPALLHVGSKRRSTGIGMASLPGQERAMFMEGSAKAIGLINSVSFFLRENSRLSIGRSIKGDVSAPFRVRIFERDSITGKPGRELIKDIILTTASEKDAWHKVDLSAYRIRNPSEGFFVCFSLLNENYYEYFKNKVYRIGVYQNYGIPYLGISDKEFKKPLSYVLEHYDGNWRIISQRNYLISADIIKAP